MAGFDYDGAAKLEHYFFAQLKGGSIMNRNYSQLLSVAVLLAALPTFNLGASGATAVGADVSATAPDY